MPPKQNISISKQKTAATALLLNISVSTKTTQVKYDLLVSNAIKFLTSVAERPQYAELFSNEETLQNICEKVLVPNMKLRGALYCLF